MITSLWMKRRRRRVSTDSKDRTFTLKDRTFTLVTWAEATIKHRNPVISGNDIAEAAISGKDVLESTVKWWKKETRTETKGTK